MLTANLMDGKAVADEVLRSIGKNVGEHEIIPSLHVILVGEDEPSLRYIRHKTERAKGVGINTCVHKFDEHVEFRTVQDQVHKLNEEPDVDGVIIQLPLPEDFETVELLSTLDPRKDVDGLHPLNFGHLLGNSSPYFYPPTPLGILQLLKKYDVEFSGLRTALVGMGRLVGRPLSQMLLNRDATVACLNVETRNLAEYTRQAELVVAGAGVPELIDGEHISENTVVVDAGVHSMDDGLVGDVCFEEVSEIARLITPVPGGVGPLTVAYLLKNTVASALD